MILAVSVWHVCIIHICHYTLEVFLGGMTRSTAQVLSPGVDIIICTSGRRVHGRKPSPNISRLLPDVEVKELSEFLIPSDFGSNECARGSGSDEEHSRSVQTTQNHFPLRLSRRSRHSAFKSGKALQFQFHS